jgi:CheY-like chemotaxis protein
VLSNLDALDAQETVAEGFYDLMLIDGVVLNEDMQSMAPKIPRIECLTRAKIVLMTKMSDKTDAQYYKNIGVTSYFPKPVGTGDLCNTLRILSEDNVEMEQQLLATKLSPHKTLDEHAHTVFDNVRILLVEDNSINQEVAKSILVDDFNCAVDVAANGIEAIELLKTRID